MVVASPARVIALSIAALALLGGLWWLNDLRVERARREAEQREQAAARAERERLAGTTTLAIEAATARSDAEQAHAAVLEAALGVTLLEAREALLPQARFDVLERIARTALEPYASRGDESLTPAALRVKRAAFALLGEALAGRGLLPEAADAAGQALQLARLAVAAEPTSSSARHALARSHAALGDILALRLDHAGALAERRDALALLRALNDREPAALGWLGALADTLADASQSLLALGRAGEALAFAEESVGVLSRLGVGEPANPLWPRQEARALAAKAAALQAGGGAREAVDETYAAARARLAPLLEAQPKDPALTAEQADLLLAHGRAQLAASRPTEAEATLRTALSIAAALVGDRPAERRAHERLAEACDALAASFEAAGDLETAADGRAEAVRAWRRVAALPPETPSDAELVLHALLAQGDVLSRLSRHDDALLVYRDALDLALAQSESPSVHPSHGSDLAECHDRLASTLLALDRRSEALETWRSALSIIEPLAKKTPENAFFQADLARIWWHLGSALSLSEPDRPDADRALRRALRYLTDLEDSKRLPAYAAEWPAAVRDQVQSSGVSADPPSRQPR
jgi:tetratricopeptide (TPR) repeat protein